MATRSGALLRARNQPFYTSVRELMRHHQRLINENPAVTQQVAIIANSGSLIQTTVRFPITSNVIRVNLQRVFTELLTQLEQGHHFEVIITFNAILYSPSQGTYSLFYGHDFRQTNQGGRAVELAFYDNSTIVRTPFDVNRIPIDIDYDRLLHLHRNAFESSNVYIHSFVNIVYLIYKYVPAAARQRRPPQPH
jgi:hypothetical protein